MARFLFILSLVTALLLPATNTYGASKLDGIIPLTTYPCDGPLILGVGTTLRVQLSGPAQGTEEVRVSCTTGLFLGLPVVVTPEPGATYVDVEGLLLLNLSGTANIRAAIGTSVVITGIEILEQE